jgi:hypothetical protein
MEEVKMDDERRRLQIPDRRKNTYAALEAKVHEYFDEVESRLNSNAKKALRLQAAIDEQNAPPEAKAEVRRRRNVTLQLIDSLAPIQNCQQLAKEGLKGG